MTAQKINLKKLCSQVIETKNVAELLGFCNSVQSLNCDTLDPFVEYGIVDHIYNLFLHDDVCSLFQLPLDMPRTEFVKELKKVCLDTLAVLVTSRDGAVRFEKLYETKTFNNEVQSMLTVSKEHYMSVCNLISNLCIHKRKLITSLNVMKVIGDEHFSCFDEKDEDVMLKRVYSAFNYYKAGIKQDIMKHFIDKFETAYMSNDHRIAICNLLYGSMKAANKYTLLKRVRRIEANTRH